MSEDFYTTLGVSRDASQADIKQAYRKLARQYHPDRNPGDQDAADRFKDAAEAYRVLGDTDLRQQYDDHQQNNPGGAPMGESPEEVLNDIFGTEARVRGRRSQGRRRPRKPTPEPTYAERGDDLKYQLEVDFEDAALGGEKTISAPQQVSCDRCGGTGARSGSTPMLCSTCHGSGSVRVQQGFFDATQRCPDCQGTGRLKPQNCEHCQGSGAVMARGAISVTIPAGVTTGTRLRMRGYGAPGGNGAPPGDLVVEVTVRPHPLFEREDDDVLTEVPITFSQAALGAQVEIPTLEGRMRMRVPAGSQSGRVFRLRGKGFLSKNGKHRGDQRVRVLVETPERLSHTQRALLEQLSEIEEMSYDGTRVGEYLNLLEDYYD